MRGHRIEVRNKSREVVEIIRRKLRAKAVGNFNPIFCVYRGRKFLVQSDKGDLSNLFRRERSYLNSLYIKLKGATV